MTSPSGLHKWRCWESLLSWYPVSWPCSSRGVWHRQIEPNELSCILKGGWAHYYQSCIPELDKPPRVCIRLKKYVWKWRYLHFWINKMLILSDWFRHILFSLTVSWCAVVILYWIILRCYVARIDVLFQFKSWCNRWWKTSK